MSQVVCDISLSVDGYAAGPNQTLEKPFGDGPVDDLHAWMFEPRRENEAEVSAITAAGAFVMGRKKNVAIAGGRDAERRSQTRARSARAERRNWIWVSAPHEGGTAR
jgi:hypothetical protein